MSVSFLGSFSKRYQTARMEKGVAATTMAENECGRRPPAGQAGRTARPGSSERSPKLRAMHKAIAVGVEYGVSVRIPLSKRDLPAARAERRGRHNSPNAGNATRRRQNSSDSHNNHTHECQNETENYTSVNAPTSRTRGLNLKGPGPASLDRRMNNVPSVFCLGKVPVESIG